ncbi:hypothetical protein HYALB_00003825 [Hymenoscyphus albidus]|uniref:chitinase n=1 Tax=Hymenoscyphus albidus TaxID=595503 RepID=A0A9N9QB82_9HELO|nr:hypothetical protein HYALB_00003825 [Hymenoscyphus albidus]
MHYTSLLSLGACCGTVLCNSEEVLAKHEGHGGIDGWFTGKRANAFYGNWSSKTLSLSDPQDIYARNFTVTQIPVSKLTHISYAFCNISTTTGEVVLSDENADLRFAYPGEPKGLTNATSLKNIYGNVKQLFLLKKKNRTLKTMLSVGGYSFSPYWSAMLASEPKRARFASSAVKLMTDLGFDGLDYDYEYVTNASQAADLIDLLKKTRTLMDEHSQKNSLPRFSLSFDGPAGPAKYTLLDMRGMDRYLDFWNFMAFDYSGGWDTIAGHAQNLYGGNSKGDGIATPFNTSTGINYYIDNGIAPSKINLGNPLYGHAFLNTTGPGQRFNGTGIGSFGEAGGNWDTKALPLKANYSSAEVTELKDIGASYSYSAKDRMMISFDTPDIAKMKARYAMKKGLGGAMWWEISQDKSGKDSLVGSFVGELRGLEKSMNNLKYPTSVYENMRLGFPDN